MQPVLPDGVPPEAREVLMDLLARKPERGGPLEPMRWLRGASDHVLGAISSCDHAVMMATIILRIWHEDRSDSVLRVEEDLLAKWASMVGHVAVVLLLERDGGVTITGGDELWGAGPLTVEFHPERLLAISRQIMQGDDLAEIERMAAEMGIRGVEGCP